MSEQTITHAIEKVAFRLGLQNEGHVTLARVFIELPFPLDIVDEKVTEITDGRTMLKDEAGDYNSIQFPEFSALREAPPLRDDCPLCGGELPPCISVGGVPSRGPAICDACYRALADELLPDTNSALMRIRNFFTEPDPDPLMILRLEHEILFHGLQLGGGSLTHTAIAAHTRFPMAEVKDRLNTMGARRFVRFGLNETGDAVAYRFPEGLTYPEPLYQRFCATIDALQGEAGRRVKRRNDRRNDRRMPGTSPGGQRPSTSRLSIDVRSRSSGRPSGSVRPSGRLEISSDRSGGDAGSGLRIVVKRRGADEPEPANTAGPASGTPSPRVRISVRSAGAEAEPEANNRELEPGIVQRPLPPADAEPEPATDDPSDADEFLDVNPVEGDPPPAGSIVTLDPDSADKNERETMADGTGPAGVIRAEPATDDVVISGPDVAGATAPTPPESNEEPATVEDEGAEPAQGEDEDEDDGISAGEFIGTPVD